MKGMRLIMVDQRSDLVRCCIDQWHPFDACLYLLGGVKLLFV